MAQNDMNVANQGFPAFRADLNDQLEALVTNSSGATAPAALFSHQWWVDTSTTPNTLRQRNADNDAWITIGLINQSANTFNLSVAQGGTGAADAAGARTNLGAQAALVSGTNIKTIGGVTLLGSGDIPAPEPTIASTAEAQAGTNNTNFLTPLRMREGFNASGSAPVYACRAWVNFNGTGTVAIRASGNVSSITDNGTGDYTVNFTTAMPDADYSIGAMAGNTGTTNNRIASFRTASTSSLRFTTQDSSGTLIDVNTATIQIFR